ncbi:MAG: hypothetical protein LUG18_05980 [Candidatus Azobacteroides sp.]|nr:hypothetical protein [Candidatus Azobacteroides sp.]
MNMKSFTFILTALLFYSALPLSVFSQEDSMYIHSEGKIIFKEKIEKIDSITFSAPSVPPVLPKDKSRVLLLKVDYTTTTFEGGTELIFKVPVDELTLEKEYVAPGDDSGYINFFYPEINEHLFFGTMVRTGLGKIKYPEDWMEAEDFEEVLTDDFIFPKSGFTDLHKCIEINEEDFLSNVWSRVERLMKVREYLRSNPTQKVKFFLYTPTYGEPGYKDATWIFFIYD